MRREFSYRNHGRERPLAQIGPMRAAFPYFRHRITRQGGVHWTGELRPTIESSWYQLVILHELNSRPRTWVTSPQLAPNPPHVYHSDDDSLCLYWPKEWSWTPAALLAATIVPWSALWLYYYEAWQVTGEWLGPSSPHGSAARK
jgi:hypothetical protein